MPLINRLSTVLLPMAFSGAMASAAVPASAQTPTISWIEWEDVSVFEPADGGSGSEAPALAVYGPFRVVDPETAEMHGMVTSDTPAQFVAMRKAFPQIATLRMLECPGSDDDEANLALARMVRAARIATVVPAGGSVRSGAVELFLAGVEREADSRAEFAVHSWRDELGREAGDVGPNDPVHREYLDFYREMGLSDESAASFYALTASVPFDQALYLAPVQLAQMGMLKLSAVERSF